MGVSLSFSKPKDALQCLTDNGYHPQLVEMLRETEHVPSLIGTSKGMYPCGPSTRPVHKGSRYANRWKAWCNDGHGSSIDEW